MQKKTTTTMFLMDMRETCVPNIQVHVHEKFAIFHRKNGPKMTIFGTKMVIFGPGWSGDDPPPPPPPTQYSKGTGCQKHTIQMDMKPAN